MAKIGRLLGDQQSVEVLENLIERQSPYFSDFFFLICKVKL